LCARRIRIKSIHSDTDVPMLAEAIVNRCEFLCEAQLGEVIGFLYELQSHAIEAGVSVRVGAVLLPLQRDLTARALPSFRVVCAVSE